MWSTILQAPVYEFEDVNQNGVRDPEEEITAYFVYMAEELNVPAGYIVSYVMYDPSCAGDYELTITNKLSIPLPDTDSVGDGLFVVLGVGIVLLALAVPKRRRKE